MKLDPIEKVIEEMKVRMAGFVEAMAEPCSCGEPNCPNNTIPANAGDYATVFKGLTMVSKRNAEVSKELVQQLCEKVPDGDEEFRKKIIDLCIDTNAMGSYIHCALHMMMKGYQSGNAEDARTFFAACHAKQKQDLQRAMEQINSPKSALQEMMRQLGIEGEIIDLDEGEEKGDTPTLQ